MKTCQIILFTCVVSLLIPSFVYAEVIALNEPVEITVDVRSSIEISFDTEIGVYYQIQISPDMENWDNEGYSIKGTGGEMTVYASTRHYDKSVYYRLIDNGDPNNIAPTPSLSSYDSGWFSISRSSSYSKVHNLGTTKQIISLYGSFDGGATQFQIISWADGTADTNDALTLYVQDNQYIVYTSSNNLLSRFATPGNPAKISSGCSLRIVALALP